LRIFLLLSSLCVFRPILTLKKSSYCFSIFKLGKSHREKTKEAFWFCKRYWKVLLAQKSFGQRILRNFGDNFWRWEFRRIFESEIPRFPVFPGIPRIPRLGGVFF
jgi:hypothetical protein